MMANVVSLRRKPRNFTTAVQVQEEDPRVDLLPRQLLELMVLPDGAAAPGTSVTVATPFGDVTSALAPLDGGVATLRTTMAGSQVTAEGGKLTSAAP